MILEERAMGSGPLVPESLKPGGAGRVPPVDPSTFTQLDVGDG
jgi:hypothetical protein